MRTAPKLLVLAVLLAVVALLLRRVRARLAAALMLGAAAALGGEAIFTLGSGLPPRQGMAALLGPAGGVALNLGLAVLLAWRGLRLLDDASQRK